MSDQTPKEGELILYRTANDAVRVEVLYESKTFWLDGVDVRTVSDHLRNVYGSGELSEEATLRKLRMVRTEGGREVARDIVFYHLGAIIGRLPGQQCSGHAAPLLGYPRPCASSSSRASFSTTSG